MINTIITLLISAMCVFFGVLYESRIMIYLAFGLLFLILLSVIEVIYRVLTTEFVMGVPLSMAEKDKDIEVSLRMRNRSRLPMGKVRVRATVKNVFSGQQKRDWFTLVGVIQDDCRYDFKMQMETAGYYEVKMDRVQLHALSGLFCWNKKQYGQSTFWILPEAQMLNLNITEGTRNFMGEADVYDPYKPGTDVSEVIQIREYQAKDKLQSIHWKLTAKMDELMVREHGLTSPCPIVLLLDVRRRGTSPFPFIKYMEIAASVSMNLMDQKCPHYVVWFSRQALDLVRYRVDDEESYYQFLCRFLQDADRGNQKSIYEEYVQKYKGDTYLHDVRITSRLDIYKDGNYISNWGDEKGSNEEKELELIL